jgi:RNA polymerase sigma-70 factor (ECF subfamily)
MEVRDFDALYNQHAPYVRTLLRRFRVRGSEIDDAIQDTFVRIHSLIGSFEDRAKIETWIYAICWRVAAEHRRRLRPFRAAATPEESAELFSESRAGAQVHAALETMNAIDRDIFVLREIGELTVSALSDLTGAARTTVRRRLERARIALEHHIKYKSRARSRESGGCLLDEQAIARLAKHVRDEYICTGYAFSTCSDTVMAVWRSSPDATAATICAKVTLAASDATKRGICCLTVIEPSSVAPDRSAREVLAGLVAKLGSQLNALAVVMVGGGLRPLVPSIVNSYIFTSGRKLNVRFFLDVHEALTWLALYSPETCVSEQVGHYERLRLRMSRASARERKDGVPTVGEDFSVTPTNST